MLLWFLMNIALPLFPLVVVALMLRILGSRRDMLEILGDGQLFYFSVALCGVFAFDALRANRLDPHVFAIGIFMVLALTCFYMASLMVEHIDGAGAHQGLSRRLARISILATMFTAILIGYSRWRLGLI